MNLAGTYTNTETKAVLTITQADDSNGQLSGTLATNYNGSAVTLTVSGHYHYLNSAGPQTSLAFIAVHDDSPASIYEAWSGITDNRSYKTLEVQGTRAALTQGQSRIRPACGDFVRNN